MATDENTIKRYTNGRISTNVEITTTAAKEKDEKRSGTQYNAIEGNACANK